MLDFIFLFKRFCEQTNSLADREIDLINFHFKRK